MIFSIIASATLMVGPDAVRENCAPYTAAYACYDGQTIYMNEYADFLPAGIYSVDCPDIHYPSYANTEHSAWRIAGLKVLEHNEMPMHVNAGLRIAHECKHVRGSRH